MYTTIFDTIPWTDVGYSVLQTAVIYWLVLIGIKLTGRRVFSGKSPEDLIILLLVAESCDLGLAHEDAGFWGTVFSVLTIFAMGGFVERCRPLKKLLDGKPTVLFQDGELRRKEMTEKLVTEEDLQQVAREYGLADYHDFDRMTLEAGGILTGTLKSGISRRAENDSGPV